MQIDNRTQLLRAMKNGAWVITPNKRLSNELLAEFVIKFPVAAQAKPHCLPYTAFLINAWQILLHQYPNQAQPLLLTAHQEHYLWRQVIASSQFILTPGLLMAVQEAWQRCQLWLLQPKRAIFLNSPASEQLQQWSEQFANKLQELNAITSVQIVNFLCGESSIFTPKTTIIWACFDDFTPQQKKLQQHLQQQGCQLQFYDLQPQEFYEKTPAKIWKYAAHNTKDEEQQLLYWLQTRVALGDLRIGVIVPNLADKAQHLRRILTQYFPNQFNISLGKSLLAYPLVAHAIQWLQLDNKQLNYQQSRLLLYSSYLAYSQSEMLARAQVLEECQLLSELCIAQASFISTIQVQAPKLAGVLKKMESYPEITSTAAWLDIFKTRLHTLGFPGETELTSENYQLYQRFLILFDEFKQLSLIKSTMTQLEALTTFQELAELTIFQPQTRSTPIQILGLLEAAGGIFDSMWVTNLSDDTLPQALKPSAFIPAKLQYDYQMPHAHPGRELFLAEKMLARLASASPIIIFSYPLLVDDMPKRSSPLIANYATYQTLPSLSPNNHQSKLQLFTDDYLLPLGSAEQITGGTSILANQVLCPFQAFAIHRLHAKPPLETTCGLTPLEHGQLFHKSMELIWKILKDQTTLLSLDVATLNEYIEAAINTAITTIMQKKAQAASLLIQEVEFERLKILTYACLEWEKQRPSFTVEGLEQVATIKLANLVLTLRIDRLDKMENGTKWVIDYKTTLPQALPWYAQRPQDPQLLLYCLLDPAINTLLFAQLKNQKLTIKGLTAAPEAEQVGASLIAAEHNWSQLREDWHERLSQVAEEFSAGFCPPQPHSATICQRCKYKNLCRLHMDQQSFDDNDAI